MTDADALAEVGRHLWGGDWKACVAILMDRTWLTVHRWSQGTSPVPAEVWPKLWEHWEENAARRGRVGLMIGERLPQKESPAE